MAKVLIVDDDLDIIETTRMILEREGHEVSSAGNRKEGMIAMWDVKPDILVLDVMMEQEDDGFVMAQELRRQGHRLPIIMLTSINSTFNLDFGKDNEMVPVDEFLEKPVKPQVLIDKIKAHLVSKEA